MGSAYFIVLDKKKPGFDTFVNGKAVARESDAIAKITKRLKLPDINDLTSFAAIAAEYGADPNSEAAREKWFTASEGLQWVRAIYEYIDTHPRCASERAAIQENLDEYREVLTEAQRIKAKWHFEIDI